MVLIDKVMMPWMQFVTPLSIIATSHLNIPGRPPSHSIQLHKVLRPPQLQAPWNIIVFVNKKSIFKTIMTTVAVVIMIVDNGVIDAHEDESDDENANRSLLPKFTFLRTWAKKRKMSTFASACLFAIFILTLYSTIEMRFEMCDLWLSTQYLKRPF